MVLKSGEREIYQSMTSIKKDSGQRYAKNFEVEELPGFKRAVRQLSHLFKRDPEN